jgi:hypothetical protein
MSSFSPLIVTGLGTENEFDGEDTFFGLVESLDEELGYFSLSELQEYRGRLGIGIARDLHFKPTPLSQKSRHND